jgi:hypothetical protein
MDRFRRTHQNMRQIDIFRKKLHAIQIPTVFPKLYMRMHTHTHRYLEPKQPKLAKEHCTYFY